MLPRKTPVGFLHRLLWIKIPAFFRQADVRLTGGRLGPALQRLDHYLMDENHPLVLVRRRTERCKYHLMLDRSSI